MTQLIDRILALNAEAGWQHDDVERPDVEVVVFARFAEQLLSILKEHIPGISFACMSVAGIECGFLKPVATWPPDAKSRAKSIRRQDANVLHNENNQQAVLTGAPAELHPLLSRFQYRPECQLTIKLLGYGEYYGLIWLDAAEDGTFSKENVEQIKTATPALLRIVAEANFSMRLQRLAAPIESQNSLASTNEEIFNYVARQAALGLAADGSLVRILDKTSKQLVIRGVHGEPGVNANEDLPILQRIGQMVFESDHGFGAAHNLLAGQSFGVPITEIERKELCDSGIASFMIMRLQSDLASSKGKANIGTLMVVYHQPNAFSLRNIRLARMFAERVADDLGFLKLQEELNESSLMLSMQYSLIGRAEVVALLSHDLGHKAIQITERVQHFAKMCRKAIREKRNPEVIEDEANQLIEASHTLEGHIHKIRQLSYRVDEQPVKFDVLELLKEIGSTLRPVLDRLNMSTDIQSAGRTVIYGPRGVFGQAIFNLMINSIDAQRTSLRHRKNIIHIHCRPEVQGDKQRIIIHFSDEGPGISFHHFPQIENIFSIGATSKPEGQGTGTGLSVARSLLNKYFRGDINILERRPPVFLLTIPAVE